MTSQPMQFTPTAQKVSKFHIGLAGLDTIPNSGALIVRFNVTHEDQTAPVAVLPVFVPAKDAPIEALIANACDELVLALQQGIFEVQQIRNHYSPPTPARAASQV